MMATKTIVPATKTPAMTPFGTLGVGGIVTGIGGPPWH